MNDDSSRLNIEGILLQLFGTIKRSSGPSANLPLRMKKVKELLHDSLAENYFIQKDS